MANNLQSKDVGLDKIFMALGGSTNKKENDDSQHILDKNENTKFPELFKGLEKNYSISSAFKDSDLGIEFKNDTQDKNQREEENKEQTKKEVDSENFIVKNNNVPCSFCQEIMVQVIQYKGCHHKTCFRCFFRTLFCRYLDKLKTDKDMLRITCKKCQKESNENRVQGYVDISIEQLLQMAQIKYKFDIERDYSGKFKKSKKCLKHTNTFFDSYCTDCNITVCKKCALGMSSPHRNHRIIEEKKALKLVRKQNESLILGLKERAQFDELLKSCINELKSNIEKKFVPILKDFDSIISNLTQLRNDFEKNYKIELNKSLRVLRLIKLFYYSYFLEKDYAEKVDDAKILVFLNDIGYEFSKLQVNYKGGMQQKMNEIQSIISQITPEAHDFLNLDFKFRKVSRQFRLEDVIEKAFEFRKGGANFLPRMIKMGPENNILIISDFSMSILSENEEGWYGSNTVKIDNLIKKLQDVNPIDTNNFLCSCREETTLRLCKRDNSNRYTVASTLNMPCGIPTIVKQLVSENVLVCSTQKQFAFWKPDKRRTTFECNKIYMEKNFRGEISAVGNYGDKLVAFGSEAGELSVWGFQSTTESQKEFVELCCIVVEEAARNEEQRENQRILKQREEEKKRVIPAQLRGSAKLPNATIAIGGGAQKNRQSGTSIDTSQIVFSITPNKGFEILSDQGSKGASSGNSSVRGSAKIPTSLNDSMRKEILKTNTTNSNDQSILEESSGSMRQSKGSASQSKTISPEVTAVCVLREGKVVVSSIRNKLYFWRYFFEVDERTKRQKGHKLIIQNINKNVHLAPINTIIELKDGRVGTSSKDRTICIWEKNREQKYVLQQTISEYPHGLYNLIQLDDERLCALSSQKTVVFFKDRKEIF